MDVSASGEEPPTEVPMDVSGADEASGGTEGSLEQGVGGDLSSTTDFPWPFSSCSKGQKEQTSLPSEPPGSISTSSDCYNMNHKRRGKALIINEENFSRELRQQGLSQRTGTKIDERKMRNRLEALGFQVESYTDFKVSQMKKFLSQMASEDHSDADCFVCVILSHGEEGIVFGTDKAVEIKELTTYFKGDKCPGLVGKPKVFIIQACRGYQTDAGVPVNVVDATPMEEDDVPQFIRLPIEADFLFAYSTVPGFYSWRNGMNGSWFIQALSYMLENYGETMELQKLLTKVHRMVSQDFESESSTPGFYKKKQIPSMVSMLTKDLYFRKKPKPPRR